jgi:hypothetical protein
MLSVRTCHQEYDNSLTITQSIFRAPSAATFGAAGAIVGAWAFDWKAVLQYVPFINRKYKEDDK